MSWVVRFTIFLCSASTFFQKYNQNNDSEDPDRSWILRSEFSIAFIFWTFMIVYSKILATKSKRKDSAFQQKKNQAKSPSRTGFTTKRVLMYKNLDFWRFQHMLIKMLTTSLRDSCIMIGTRVFARRAIVFATYQIKNVWISVCPSVCPM